MSIMFLTKDELINSAIDGIRSEWRRNRLKRKFEANPNKLFDRLVNRCVDCDSDECDKIAAFLEDDRMRIEIDPEKVKRWIEIIKILLPLILAFL